MVTLGSFTGTFIHSLRYNIKFKQRYCTADAEGELLRRWVLSNLTMSLNKLLNLCSSIYRNMGTKSFVYGLYK